MKSQKGMATLLVTAMLLVVSLLFSLASYKNAFYQIKRTQNEVLARQAHWRAEGGVECAISLNNSSPTLGVLNQPYSNCDSSQLDLTATLLGSGRYLISSKFNNGNSESHLYKKVKINPRTTGAIQTISDLKLIGSYSIKPDVDGALPDGKYKCVSVRYGANFYVNGAVKVLSPDNNGPYPGFSGECGSKYATDTALDTGTNDATIDAQLTPPNGDTGPLRSDFVKDLNMNPFESFFYRSRSEIAEVRKDFEVISGSISADTSNRCDMLIKEAFKITDKVWVVGSCDLLDATNLSALSNKPRILVVENGILATYGASVFNGVIYHLIDPSVYPIGDMTSAWSGVTSGNTLASTYKVKGVYYQAGAFQPTGGLVLDTRGGLSIIQASYNLTFVGGLNPNNPPQIVSWQKGSWNDF